MRALTRTLRMIRVEHSVFALPFALSGAWLAAQGVPPWADLPENTISSHSRPLWPIQI